MRPELTEFASELSDLLHPIEDRGRLQPAEREAIVCQLCAVTPLSAKELSELMLRSMPVIHAVLRTLVKDRRLSYLYPEPNHPRQRYRSVRLTDGQ